MRFLFLIVVAIFAFTPMKKETPNVLFLMVDDLRPELGVYGHEMVQSPHIDALGRESLLFERAYCNIPVCGASRASIMSGLRPGKYRFRQHFDRLSEHAPDAVSLPNFFQQRGYETISYGKIFHQKDDQNPYWSELWHPSDDDGGYLYASVENRRITKEEGKGKAYATECLEVPDDVYDDAMIANKAVEKIEELGASGKSFFLAVGFLKPHLPFTAPKKYWDLYKREEIKLPEVYYKPEGIPEQAYHKSGELRSYYGVPNESVMPEKYAKELVHGYYACVSFTDAQIGKVLEALKKSGLDKNTIVVLVGDHGWNLGEHTLWNKHCNFETSLRTPLMVRFPEMTSGKRVKNVVEFVDIYPTLLEQMGETPYPHAYGESLYRFWDEKPRKKDYAIARWQDGYTYICGDYFYTQWLDKAEKPVAHMLFNQKEDPTESKNLAALPEYRFLTEHFAKQLEANRDAYFFKNWETK